jgi:chromate transporter
MRETIWQLVMVFVPFSLISFGGGTSIFAGIQHQAVDIHHWTTPRQFTDLFAIVRAAPGPGSMLATAVGWQAAGWLGAVVATLSLFLPSSLLCYAIAGVWHRFRGRAWHSILQAALAPIGAGLIMAGIVAIFRVAGTGPLSWVTAAGSALLLTIFPKLHPGLLLCAGAALFAALEIAKP